MKTIKRPKITLKQAKEIDGTWEIIKTGFFDEAYINIFEKFTGKYIAYTKNYSYKKLKKEFNKRGNT